METQTPTLPVLPCPYCQANILEKGFHNTCIERHSLREDNYGTVVRGRLRVCHEEKERTRITHDCGVHADCSSCGKLLPWTLFELRSLDATPMSLCEKAIARMLKKAEGRNENPTDDKTEEE